MTSTAAPVASKLFETMKNKKCGSQADKESWWTQLQATNPGRCGSLWRPKRNVQQYNPLRATDSEPRSCLLPRMDPQQWIQLRCQPSRWSYRVCSIRAYHVCSVHRRNLYFFWLSFSQYLGYLSLQTPSCFVWKAILQVPKWLTGKRGVNWPFVDTEHKHDTL